VENEDSGGRGKADARLLLLLPHSVLWFLLGLGEDVFLLQRKLKGVGDAGHVVAPGNVPDDVHRPLFPESSHQFFNVIVCHFCGM